MNYCKGLPPPTHTTNETVAVSTDAQTNAPVETGEVPVIAHPIIRQGDMPQPLHIPRDTSEKELVEYLTQTIEANIFFETGAAIRSAILAEGGTMHFGNEDN